MYLVIRHYRLSGMFVFCSAIDCLPLEMPVHKDDVIVQPGLFKGTYGDHGLELVMLTYDDERREAIITKITVSNVSFRVRYILKLAVAVHGCGGEQLAAMDRAKDSMMIDASYSVVHCNV